MITGQTPSGSQNASPSLWNQGSHANGHAHIPAPHSADGEPASQQPILQREFLVVGVQIGAAPENRLLCQPSLQEIRKGQNFFAQNPLPLTNADQRSDPQIPLAGIRHRGKLVVLPGRMQNLPPHLDGIILVQDSVVPIIPPHSLPCTVIILTGIGKCHKAAVAFPAREHFASGQVADRTVRCGVDDHFRPNPV